MSKSLNKIKYYAEIIARAAAKKTDAKELSKYLYPELRENKQLKNLDRIIDQAEILAASERGCKIARLESAKPLTQVELKEITDKLEHKTGSSIDLRQSINPLLQAGIIIRVDDQIINFSLANRKDRLIKNLMK